MQVVILSEEGTWTIDWTDDPGYYTIALIARRSTHQRLRLSSATRHLGPHLATMELVTVLLMATSWCD